jgi:hypothetical protein
MPLQLFDFLNFPGANSGMIAFVSPTGSIVAIRPDGNIHS